MKRLKELLKKIDGKSYKEYKKLKGNYSFKDYELKIIRVQGDPFASPSLFSIRLNLKKFFFERELYECLSKRTAFEDYILRKIYDKIKGMSGKLGSGKSGMLSIARPGQEILRRTAVEIEGDFLTIRFYGGLPANGPAKCGGDGSTRAGATAV